MNLQKISTKLLLAVFALVLVLGSTIGFTTYFTAKKALINSGKLDLQHLVDTSISTLTYLNENVENGNISLKEAQEKAREIILGSKIDMDDSGFIRNLKESAFLYKEHSYIFAVHSDLTETLSPYPPVKETDAFYELSREVNSKLIKAAKSANIEDRFEIYQWEEANGDLSDQIAYMSYFEPWDWNIGIGAYTSEFYESLTGLKWLTIIITSVMMIVTLTLFYFMSKGIFIIMARITSNSQFIANGDLQVGQLPESNNELGQLSKSFNTMTNNLRNLINHLQTTSGKLLHSATNLSSMAAQTHASTDETSVAMDEISKGVVSQTEDIEVLRDNLELLNASMERMEYHNQEIIKITDESKNATENGMKVVETLKYSNGTSIKASDDINKGMTVLYEKIKNISSITEAIKSISAQTNLLALNASIEAARAGEHGKGFAVVADEVRKLAEDSNQATLKIETMIDEIEVETEATMQAMNNTIATTEKLNDDVIKVESDFKHISDAVGKTVQSVKQLANEIENTSKQSENMLLSMQNVSAVSEQTSAAIEEISASMHEQLTAMKNGDALANELTKVSKDLDGLIQNYKL